MNAGPSNLGVAAAPAPPSAATNLTQPEPACWPRSAQVALAALLGLALGLLAWYGYGTLRLASRPTDLDTPPQFTRLDLNRADHAQLIQMPNVGDNLARRIEAYRTEHHGFRDVDELRHVSGIGPTMLERLRPFVYVEVFEDDEPDAPTPRHSFFTPPPATTAMNADKKANTKKAGGPKGLIDVNRATAAQLQQLPGVGPKLSSSIIEAREQQPFKKVDDLRRVHGIGAKTLDNLRPYITVDPVETNQ